MTLKLNSDGSHWKIIYIVPTASSTTKYETFTDHYFSFIKTIERVASQWWWTSFYSLCVFKYSASIIRLWYFCFGMDMYHIGKQMSYQIYFICKLHIFPVKAFWKMMRNSWIALQIELSPVSNLIQSTQNHYLITFSTFQQAKLTVNHEESRCYEKLK